MTGRLWFMVACGVVIVLIGGGLRQIFGVFQVEVTQELDIGFGPFGLVIGIQALILGITQPASGLLADKFGSVRVIIAGALILSIKASTLSLERRDVVTISDPPTSSAILEAAAPSSLAICLVKIRRSVEPPTIRALRGFGK